MWQKAQYVFHWFIIVLGLFFLGGGTYAVVKQIIAGTLFLILCDSQCFVLMSALAYATGEIGSAFACQDNSGTVGS
jgi:hypothetical protein